MTWTFSPTARPIRFYLWLYGASMDGINFCKLFWGFLFSPIALPVRLIAGTKVAANMAAGVARKADNAVGVTQRHPWLKKIGKVIGGAYEMTVRYFGRLVLKNGGLGKNELHFYTTPRKIS